MPFVAVCGSDDDDFTVFEPDELADCPAQVTLSVSGGKAPTFSWTPACGLAILAVERANAGTTVWEIVTPGMNAIEPPVQYGAAPDEASESTVPEPLADGISYRITLSRFTNPADEVGQVIGTQTFNP